jgi:hypothetical protein
MGESGRLPVNVPCAVCLEMIRGWRSGEELPGYGPQGNAVAQPCGHTLYDVQSEWVAAITARREAIR